MNIPEFPGDPVLLVDADVLAYRCAAVAEKTKYAVMDTRDGTVTYFDTAKEAKTFIEYLEQVRWERKDLQPVEFALQCVDQTVESFRKRFPGAIMLFYLSGERNFRDFLWVTKKYKGNRDSPKPTHLKAVTEYLVRNYGATISNGVEADDEIVIAHFKASPGSTCIVTIDKDLDQAAGWHWDWVTDQTYYVAPRDADTFLFEQIISGDVVDNVPGLAGYGKVKARKYLAGSTSKKELLERTIKLFQENGHETTDYMMEQASLVYILRGEGDSFKEFLRNV